MKEKVFENREKYYLRFNAEQFIFSTLDEVRSKISNALNDISGSLTLIVDDGPRSWWERYIFGLKRYNRVVFSSEWFGEFAGLILSDENSSEYRAKSLFRIEGIDERVRSKITFGNNVPIDADFIVLKKDMIKAVSDFLDYGERSEIFNYEFVF